ncbi:MAG: hypothetical protein HOP14_11260 [Acidobacteria bacterium]|nr:hypothetical protein [Acidobacteriota bacterium]
MSTESRGAANRVATPTDGGERVLDVSFDRVVQAGSLYLRWGRPMPVAAPAAAPAAVS